MGPCSNRVGKRPVASVIESVDLSDTFSSLKKECNRDIILYIYIDKRED